MPRNVFPKSPWIAWAACVILLAGIGGCGNVADVSGKISYQGRPVVYGSVILLSADHSAYSTAIKPDGSYEVADVPQGNASIAVISRNPALGRSALQRQKAASLGKQAAVPKEVVLTGWFPLPRNYEDPRRSGLLCTIAAGHVVHDIELK